MGGLEDEEPASKRMKVSLEKLKGLSNGLAAVERLGGSSRDLMARPLQSEGDSGDVIGTKGVIRRVEFVRIIANALYSLGYEKTGAYLEEESGIPLYSPAVNVLMQQIRDGKWDESVETLQKIGLPDEHVVRSASVLVLEQKFFELVERDKVTEALQTLRTEIAPYHVNEHRIRELSSCLVAPSMRAQVNSYGQQSAKAKARTQLLEELQKLLPASLMIPEKRLEYLVERALLLQRDACTFHNSLSNEMSLYTDHDCGKNQIPSQTLQVLQDHDDEVWFLQFSHNGKYLASSSSDRSAIIWEVDLKGRLSLKHKLLGHEQPISMVSWSPDDSQLLTCGVEEAVRRWDVATGECLHVYEKAGLGLVSCGWFPDGKHILAGVNDKSICMWELDGNELEGWKGQRTLKISDLEITNDGKKIISICRETAILLLDRELLIDKLIEEDQTITSFQLSRDNKFLLVNLMNQEIHLWSLEGEAELVTTYTGHKRTRFVIRSCFGGLNQAFIASGSEDSLVYIWHRGTGEVIEALEGHSGSVNCVSWNPANPHMLASGSDDRTIRIWGLRGVDVVKCEDRTRFPLLKPTDAAMHRSSSAQKKRGALASLSTCGVKSSGQDWNFDTTIETPPDKDELNGFSTHWSSEKAGMSHHAGAGISIERRLPSKQPSYFSTKLKKNQLQALQEEKAVLVGENSALRAEIEQLEALNAVLQSDNSNNSLNDYPEAVEFAQRRLRLVQAQNLQLKRQVSLLQDAIKAHENAEVNLMAALNHWRSVIETGCEEAKAAGADQNATDTTSEPESKGSCQPIKWMLAIPDRLMNELARVEGQIRGAGAAINACFETKLRVSKLSSSFLRNNDTSLRMSEIYGRELSSLAHLRMQRINQLEGALGSVSAELDQLSTEVMQGFPPTVLTTDHMRSTAYELARRVRQLLLEVGAFGVVVPTLSASAVKPTGSTINDGDITPVDIIKVLSSTVRGPGDTKERERQAKLMLKQLHAKCTATDNDLAAHRREADYWRSAWHKQDEILCRLAKRVRHLGQKKVEWCRHYLQAPMTNLAEVFASFRQVYDENTTRQNPYLPLLVETLNMEHPMLEDALQQWQEYTKRVELKMDELVADYEANRVVLASASTTHVSEFGNATLPSTSQQIPVH